MTSITTINDLKAAILKRYISGEMYPAICVDYDLAVSKARDLSRIFLAELWNYITHHKIEHPYTPDRYRNAYGSGPRGGRFYAYYLTPTDLKSEKEFWIKLIDQVASERGSVDRKLEPSDAVDRLQLSVRVSNVLRNEGITTIQELIELISRPLMWRSVAGLGEQSRASIIDKLIFNGFKVSDELSLPSTLNIMKQALQYIKNPASLTEQEKASLIDSLEKRVALG